VVTGVNVVIIVPTRGSRGWV